MQSFKAAAPHTTPDMFCHSSFFLRGDDDFNPANAFHHDDSVDLSSSSIFSLKSSNVDVVGNSLHYDAFNTGIRAAEIVSSGTGCLDTGQFMYQKGTTLGNGHIENWGDSGLADNSQQTDTSTDVDTDDKNQELMGIIISSYLVMDLQLQHGAIITVDQSKLKTGDQKTLRRLAQNREAARKSRLRKKVTCLLLAYVQQLESSRLRLTRLEQELQKARQQGIFIASGLSGGHGLSVSGNAALAFDMDYAHWLNEHQRLINDLRSGLNSHLGDSELRILVESVMAHYDEVFKLKSIGVKADAFHMLSGMWKTPAERCFMWLGGFRSSELLKILGKHLEPLTDQQLMGICNLQQSSQQAEDALSQGMEALQQALVDTLSSACLGPTACGNVADYMSQMAIAMSKLATLENFLHQADLLRHQTLQQMHRILTTRQAARALLVFSDYNSRLRALSSLWLARPRN
ncbi:transcription factor TGA2.3 isoform X1 [Gossypium hirsutum]|uniref:Transcription factor TGA2.3 isoform X1 n=2 Tax=Gossypium hirsutum TaxID=3635 RepID=A0ABM3BGP7_GOSHI|nr:transcription factor TGA2.3-like isoform X1 [Gossypium hirsutum]